MTPLDQALAYSERGWPVFPAREREPRRKQPYTPHGHRDASRDPEMIGRWWRQWPKALIGLPTGGPSGVVVLDIDAKSDAANGYDSLEDLGIILPETPMAHTPSGGVHIYFQRPDRELRCSAGVLGPGLDVRASGGYAILPGPGSGYSWDPIYHFGVCEPAPAPDWLWPHRPSRPEPPQPIRPAAGLSRYAEAAIEAACTAIARADSGQQERVLNAEAFSIGTLAGAGAVPPAIALRALLRAAAAMPDYDPAWPWRPEEIEAKVTRAFRAGEARPREVRRAVA